MTPDELAQACADAMWADDNATQHLGMVLSDVRAGQAVMTMIVRPEMTNGHKICHGGYIFTLSDSAFAFACNTYNQRVVAQMAQVTFLAPAFEGDVLRAEAREVWRQGRGGIYDISVTRQDGVKIAEFRGHSRTVKGTHLPEE
ncbi:hydroxyphenylacetyl-CoA thioesterase PaaI [Rhodobacter sp. NTK016B]|uniref:hydroxyphenylacetyl-CoA thioesterase PaaI n=1 Tax=Rhodobacter sp. NTK016B TaxID=2759676 RepID=UPI001A8E03C6|nr:hydroxyphenylacetyl-CoA thioesterase PaaI [Rhodobacter sp. NTK016B]MBN8294097.1 hydroxyphenylacetyl-CoA thioesterase PaaI [Rhodobacter sp. NTK016B]